MFHGDTAGDKRKPRPLPPKPTRLVTPEKKAMSAAEKLKLPYRDNLSDNDTSLLWNETLEAYDDEVELMRLIEQLDQQWDEEGHKRRAELVRKRAARATPFTEADVA